MSSRFKFKAWDKEKKLLTRPGKVVFSRGELIIPDCIILQFSGFTDMMDQEIYEEDILLIGEKKHHVYWDETDATWKYRVGTQSFKLSHKFSATTIRGYNAYERGEKE
jgi:YopX protein